VTKWQVHTADGFIKKSNLPASPVIPKAEVLEGCRKGLTKRMQKATSAAERQRLKDIREEIDFLIDNL
jgi:hypothetical protein